MSDERPVTLPLNATMLEVGLVVSEDDRVRLHVEGMIRIIIRDELARFAQSVDFQQAVQRVVNTTPMPGVSYAVGPSNDLFRSSVLSVMADYMQNPRLFNRVY